MMIDKIREEWNEYVGVPMNDVETLIHQDQGVLMFKLMYEELKELKDAIEDENIVEIADALGDINYLVLGTVNQYGFQRRFLPDYESRVSRYYNEGKTILRIEAFLNQFKSSINNEDIDGIYDSLWSIKQEVLIAVSYFLLTDDWHDIQEEIHRSNLTKLIDGELKRRDDGKILKPDTYEAPDLTFLTFEYPM